MQGQKGEGGTPGSLEQGVKNPTRSVYGTPILMDLFLLIPPAACISVLFISTYIGFVNYT